ncbi:MAG: sarcosine oxidase subunit delta [Gammaproteobacteria bacterium]|nr:sarcosine oxidase subunit delta [Gammaproteobacteria bacterium]MBV9697588.1 sarcosine oxidase subunit delta [Gammaproteobacteria bacterium]
MLRIPCPWCGVRDEVEFRYRGARLTRPEDGAGAEAFVSYVYARANPAGWHWEWWLHVAGCRRLLAVRRHTLTHEIAAVHDAAEAPSAAGPA